MNRVADRMRSLLGRARHASRRIQDVHDDGSPLAEALHLVSQSFSSPKLPGARIIVVSSAVPSEGKSFVASGLALVLAREGRRVLLVDAHLSRSSLHHVFQVDPDPGVLQLLRDSVQTAAERPGASAVSQVAQRTASGVDIVPAGTSGTPLVGPYAPRSVATLMEALRLSGYEDVVVDSPPLLTNSGANLLAASADDVLLTVRSGYSRERHLKEVRALLERNGAPLSGIILNDHADFPNGLPSFGQRSRRERPPLFSRAKTREERRFLGTLGVAVGPRTVPISAPVKTRD